MGLRVEEWDLLAAAQLVFILVGAWVVCTTAMDWLFGDPVAVEDERSD